MKKFQKLTLKELGEGVLNRERRVLAQALTLIEGKREDQQQLAQELLKELLPHSGRSLRIGLSGVPGAGKSTFIERFGMMLLKMGHRVAVLAVDPSSERSGGSLLGDKTRMSELAASEEAFIRPSPSQGELGGVAQKTQEAILVCEAAGYDVILVETVGVGQSETFVAKMVDFFVMLMIPGAGDELQGIKRGILEVVDLVVVNKADGDRVLAAQQAQRSYEMALHILNSGEEQQVTVLTCSALEGEGLKNIWEELHRLQDESLKLGHFHLKREKQLLSWMWNLVEHRVLADLKNREGMKVLVTKVEKEIKQKKMTSFEGAEKVIDFFYSK